MQETCSKDSCPDSTEQDETPTEQAGTPEMTTTTVPNDTVPTTTVIAEEAIQEEILSEPPTKRLQAEALVEPQSDGANHVTMPPITTSNDECLEPNILDILVDE